LAEKYKSAVVCGGGGFIGGHFAADLLKRGMKVKVVDVKPMNQWYQVHKDAENVVADLNLLEACRSAVKGATSSTTSPATWAAWASSSTTRACA
jgi:UDP-glucose 4-epimerase